MLNIYHQSTRHRYKQHEDQWLSRFGGICRQWRSKKILQVRCQKFRKCSAKMHKMKVKLYWVYVQCVILIFDRWKVKWFMVHSFDTGQNIWKPVKSLKILNTLHPTQLKLSILKLLMPYLWTNSAETGAGRRGGGCKMHFWGEFYDHINPYISCLMLCLI